jgi:hypothetical protein
MGHGARSMEIEEGMACVWLRQLGYKKEADD